MTTISEGGIMPIVNIVGERVALGPLCREHIPLHQRWINDLAIARNIGIVTPTTFEGERQWYDHVPGDQRRIEFTIYERAAMRPVGTTGLSRIDYRHRRAEFGILIGEADARGRGYGTETARLMLDYAFTALGLHSVFLTVAQWNAAGQRAYAKAGFRECGRRRECWQMGGRLWDEVHMDCLATEFVSLVRARVFAPDEPR